MKFQSAAQKIKSIIAKNFSCIAALYDNAAVLHQEIGTRLIERLDLISLNPTTILDLGAGTGHGSKMLSQKYPNAIIYNVDISEGMLLISKNTSKQSHALQICADGEQLPFKNQSIDFVFSNGFLQYFSYPQNVLEEIFRILKPEGFIMFATFGSDTLRELRHSFAAIQEPYPVQSFSDMHDLGDLFIKIGFQDPVMDLETLTLTYKSLEKLAEDLQQTEGLTIPITDPLISAYEGSYKAEELLPATFEIIYGLGFRGPNDNHYQVSDDGIVRIAADQIPIL